MQFHPTTLSPTGVLITEGCRGEGAYLLNSEGERFLERYAPNAMELASRDVISRAEQTEIDEGRSVEGNVLLDLRHLGAEKIIERLPGTRELSMVFAGIDPIHEPIRCVRAPTTTWGASTPMSGAAPARGPLRCGRGRVRLGPRGESAGWQRADGDDHLRQARGRARAEWVLATPRRRARGSQRADAERELKTLLDRTDGERPWRIRDELARRCTRTSGFPSRGSDAGSRARSRRPARALRARRCRGQGRSFNSDLTQALELGFMLELAASWSSRIPRKESRGAHARPYDSRTRR